MDGNKISDYMLLKNLIYSKYQPKIQVGQVVGPICFLIISIVALGTVFCIMNGNSISSTQVAFSVAAVIMSLVVLGMTSRNETQQAQEREITALDDATKLNVEFEGVEVLKQYFPKSK